MKLFEIYTVEDEKTSDFMSCIDILYRPRFLASQIQPSIIPRQLHLPHVTLGDGSERGVPGPHDGMPPSFHPLPQPPLIRSPVNGNQYGDSIAAMMQHFEGQVRVCTRRSVRSHQYIILDILLCRGFLSDLCCSAMRCGQCNFNMTIIKSSLSRFLCVLCANNA